MATQDRHGRSRNSVRSSDTVLPATLSDLGIPRQRAAELKAAQERGEVATQAKGRPKSARGAGTYPTTLSDLGIPSQRAAEMKRLAELGEERIRDAVRAEACAATVASRAVFAAGLSLSEPVHGRLHQLGSDHPVAGKRSAGWG